MTFYDDVTDVKDMYSLSRNSCAKAFGYWSRRSDLWPKKIEGGGGGWGKTQTPEGGRDEEILKKKK